VANHVGAYDIQERTQMEVVRARGNAHLQLVSQAEHGRPARAASLIA
jgi:hypothetical protein